LSTLSTTFDELEESLQSGGVSACLARLADLLEEHKKFQELFEARKMQVRHELGLPLLSNDLPAELSAEERRQIEDKLIDSYREVYRDVGLLMFRNLELNRGWMLLHAAGEEQLAAKELESLEVESESMDEFIEVALNQGVSPALGFRAVLEHYGTCNAITTYDQVMHGRPLADRQMAAAMLVRHIHRDLLSNVKADIARHEGSEPSGEQLAELIAERDWLFGQGSYHIDTTHLASTVRFARVLDDEESLRLAIDLTDYGRRLDKQFQYAGDEPFADIYPSHSLLFHAMIGEQIDEALAYFRERAYSVDIRHEGAGAAETYIALLDRLGRSEEAARESLNLIPPGIYTRGLAPTLFELCEKTGDFSLLISACREREDLLGFAASLIKAKQRCE
jgi:hypothetical protein